MSKYVFVYRAPRDYLPSAEAASEWNSWFRSLGESVVDAGNPVFERAAIGAGAADCDLGGYSLVEAADLDAAVSLAEGCPLMGAGGGVEVGALRLLNPSGLGTTVEDHARTNALDV